MDKFETKFEDKVVLTARIKRFKERFRMIWETTTKLLQRRDIPETAKDEIRKIRKEADKDDEE